MTLFWLVNIVIIIVYTIAVYYVYAMLVRYIAQLAVDTQLLQFWGRLEAWREFCHLAVVHAVYTGFCVLTQLIFQSRWTASYARKIFYKAIGKCNGYNKFTIIYEKPTL